ncbi:MAG: GAF domain-containing protein [Deltaproteobacteria bacterium]|nr:GAF domain-containing protein [Deltaproteobacteria bacterium]
MNEDRLNEDKLLQISHERDMFKRQFIKIQESYENKIHELSILKELSNILRPEMVYDQNAVWQEQIKVIKQYTYIDNIAILLLDEENKTFSLKASAGDTDNHSVMLDAIVDDETQKHVIMDKMPVIIDNIQEYSFNRHYDFMFSGSLLCVPIVHNNQVIGLLSLLHGKEGWFDQNRVRFLSMVVNEIATSIVIYRLYHKMLTEEKQRTLLSRFFSKSVTEEIYGSEGNLRLGGERKKVTILFSDLSGFTAMSEKLEQEKVVEILNAYFSVMTPIIFKHKGTLDKLMGDGMLALFGAPIVHDDDPLRAVRSAIEMISALAQFNIENSCKQWPQLSVSIGINTGEVVAGYIGSEDHLNYTAIGDAVNVAQRIQTLAGNNEIFISKTVRDEVYERTAEIDGLKKLVLLPSQKVKGKKEAIELYGVELETG